MFKGKKAVSAQVIAVDAPAYIDSSYAADTTHYKSIHKITKLGSYPPSKPTKDYP
jgi:hypothetical protein